MKVKTPCLGSICVSLQGRDKGAAYVVVGILARSFVLVADGDCKKLSCPKKKNLKHLYLSPKSAGDYGVDLSDSTYDCQIAYALKQFKAAAGK